MWRVTKHGLFQQCNFDNFTAAFAFMAQVAALAEAHQHYPRWENEGNTVQIWLATHGQTTTITEADHQLAAAIDQLLVAKPQLPTAVVREVKLFGDGGSRGNPGPSASGYILYDMHNQLLADHGVYIGVTTNNQAEYLSLKLGLEQAAQLGARIVHVYMDSMLVVNQMKGIYKIKNRDLLPVHDTIQVLVAGFEKVDFTHVPREMNKAADRAVNRALDEAEAAAPENF